MNEFFSMGGYGGYVWTAYSITLLVFGINIVVTLREKSRIKKIIKNIQIPQPSKEIVEAEH
jgi:heme exporter protein D